MTRPTLYTPANDPWAAMVAHGVTTPTMACKYRRGHDVPGEDRIRHLRSLGFDIHIDTTGPTPRAVCVAWPGREGE